MPSFHLKLAIPCLPLNGYVVEHTYFQSNTIQSSYRVSIVKNISPSFVLGCYFQKLHRIEALGIDVDVGEISDFGKCGQSKVSIDSPQKVHVDGYSDYPESFSDEVYTKMERRRKIGLANKGKVPWNKGRTHNAETCKLISQRTKEALRNPKTRKKLAEPRGPHSEERRAKIGSTQRQRWIKVLKLRCIKDNLKEKFFLPWAKSIAETAKKGGSGEKELDWDSYEKIAKELALQQYSYEMMEKELALQRAAEKEKAKEIARIRAEKAAQARAQKGMEREARAEFLAQNRKERAERREVIKRPRRSKEYKEELAIAEEIKLKQNLSKIRKRKGIIGQVSSVISNIQALEKLDLELINKEKLQKEVSLADQLQAAKNKQNVVTEASAAESYI